MGSRSVRYPKTQKKSFENPRTTRQEKIVGTTRWEKKIFIDIMKRLRNIIVGLLLGLFECLAYFLLLFIIAMLPILGPGGPSLINPANILVYPALFVVTFFGSKVQRFLHWKFSAAISRSALWTGYLLPIIALVMIGISVQHEAVRRGFYLPDSSLVTLFIQMVQLAIVAVSFVFTTKLTRQQAGLEESLCNTSNAEGQLADTTNSSDVPTIQQHQTFSYKQWFLSTLIGYLVLKPIVINSIQGVTALSFYNTNFNRSDAAFLFLLVTIIVCVVAVFIIRRYLWLQRPSLALGCIFAILMILLGSVQDIIVARQFTHYEQKVKQEFSPQQ